MSSLLRKLFGKKSRSGPGYEIVGPNVGEDVLRGWQDPQTAEQQDLAFAPLLQQMHEGKPREDFVALAAAVKQTGLIDPTIIEAGCGSGWNSEVLSHLLKQQIRYIGMDYSSAMAAAGQRRYPKIPFVVGDAANLPFANQSCDILLSGTVLMHVLNYEQAIRESRRVARRWCIFHTVPVLEQRATTVLQKRAYGQSTVVEIIFNRQEFRRLLEQAGLAIRSEIPSVDYNLQAVLGESSTTKTYVCEIQN